MGLHLLLKIKELDWLRLAPAAQMDDSSVFAFAPWESPCHAMRTVFREPD